MRSRTDHSPRDLTVWYLIATITGLILTIMDSEAFRLFLELAAYLLFYVLFSAFLWFMITQGLAWTYA